MKVSKVRAYGPGLRTGVVGHAATFRVVPHGEPGQLGTHFSLALSDYSTNTHSFNGPFFRDYPGEPVPER